MEDASAIRLYRDAIREFVGGHVSADEFEQRYLALRRQLAQTGVYPKGAAGDILDDLFSDVDAYTSIEPRMSGELNESTLRDAARLAAARLEELLAQR
jgi:hypothetical protein